ncbi:MAG TPA: hypothetical protein VII56_23240 [Rhizomicrobium sp.]
MKKPLNSYAFVLGLLAIAYAFLVVPEIVEYLRQPKMLLDNLQTHDANYVQSFTARNILGSLRSTVYGSGVLLALAVIVELIDHIRWNALPPEDRTKPKSVKQ